MSHNHHNNHAHHSQDVKNIKTAFFLNLSFTIIELIGGVLTNSMAILSDAVHDLGDSLSLGLAWYFQKLAKRGKTLTYSYGYKRFSLIGAIINSIVLVAGSIFILTEAIPRILKPEATHAGGMFILAIFGIIVNGAAVLRTRRGRSVNERVVSLHLLEDVLGWAAVLVGAAVMYFFDLPVIDPLLSVAIACFVLFNVVRNLRQTLRIILQGTPEDIDTESIVSILRQADDVTGIHDLHVWSMDGEYNVLTVHIVLRQPLSMDELACRKATLRTTLREEHIHHATIEFETSEEKCTCKEDCL